MRSIFYRSDTRDPDTNENLFVNGFTKRDVTRINPVLRNMGTAGNPNVPRAPDVHPHSAVCFTSDFYGAPIFPVGNPETQNQASWVYVLDLDVGGVLNTQKTQFELVEQLGGNTPATGAQALWPMFGQERCANAIANTDIVGALRVARSFRAGFALGGTFVCALYKPNPHYTGTEGAHVQTAMTTFINGGTHNTPTQAQGLVHNTRT